MKSNELQPNIVFICLDELASQAIGPYGNKIVHTPNMDRLASQGVCFDNFWCNSPLCGPARFSIFTGHMSFPNLMAHAACMHYPYLDYMGDYFHNIGYSTFSVGKLHGIPPDFDFGFRHCRINGLAVNHPIKAESYSSWLLNKMSNMKDGEKLREQYEKHIQDRCYWYNCDRTLEEHYFFPTELSENEWILEESELFLKENSDSNKPFLMHIGINHPHGAWFVQPTEDEHVYPEDVELPETFEIHWNTKPIARNAHAEPYMMENITEKWNEHDWKRWFAKYYTSVNQADKAIGYVMNLLEQYGCFNNTIIVLTTDHGEMLGSYKLDGKYLFYNNAARIPFIVSGHGIPCGERRRQLADQLDIIPTLLDFAMGTIPEKLEGISLKPAIINSMATTKPLVHGWLGFKGRQHTMTVTERYKLCTFNQGTGTKDSYLYDLGYAVELYDLKNDPYEYNNIYGDVDNVEIRELLKKHCDYFNMYNIMLNWIMKNDKEKGYSPPVLRTEACLKSIVATTFNVSDELREIGYSNTQ